MSARRSRGPKPQRICGVCKAGISEQRPPFLVSTVNGAIVGPFHAGCAELIVLKARKMVAAGLTPDQLYSIYGREPREETLPW